MDPLLILNKKKKMFLNGNTETQSRMFADPDYRNGTTGFWDYQGSLKNLFYYLICKMFDQES